MMSVSSSGNRRCLRGHHQTTTRQRGKQRASVVVKGGRAGSDKSPDWKVREKWQNEGEDYLVRLGKESSNTNTEVGARKGMVGDQFIGTGKDGKFVLGRDSDIASGDLRYIRNEMRTFNNIMDGYYIAPSFIDKVTMHVVKNILADKGSLPQLRPPLIMGLWGGKGQGKSFQLELCCKRLGMSPIIMSAGELESEVAGEPGKMIRSRYRAAAETMKRTGKMSCLIINDIDAGVGRFARTQHTVNSQIVMGSLMNLCDHPNKVPWFGAVWRDGMDEIPRTPIFLTGNDMSTLYAPLLRDGRMEKFYWQPSREDLTNILLNIFEKDGITLEMIDALIDEFPSQSLDFFGALRSRLADQTVREWTLNAVGLPFEEGERDDFKILHETLVKSKEKPEVDLPLFDLDEMIAAGQDLEKEQDMVNRENLASEYMKDTGESLIGIGLNG